MKTPLLFLCHRIPYPPNKGDKIRSFHLLHHLSQHFDIYLATFVDDPADWPYASEVEKLCRDCLFIEQKKWPSKIRGLTGLVTGQALSIPCYGSSEMHKWVRQTVGECEITHAMVFSSVMAQYILDTPMDFERRIVDFVDVDSDKWQQYAEQTFWPLNWVYRREARYLLAYEKHLAEQFDAGLFVSSTEAELFKQLSPQTTDKIGFYNNGVNTKYFCPGVDRVSPYPSTVRAIVFTGAMDYWPNIDAVVWFAREILPALRVKDPGLEFYIVGSNPSKAVLQLSSNPGVVVTGRVEDIRPYVQYAVAAVAPLRIARGVQNKVLEAMAMEKLVLVSSKGLEGIAAENAVHVLIADTVGDYVDMWEQAMTGSFADIGNAARHYVSQNFDWDSNLPEVVLLLAANMRSTSDKKLPCHG